MSPTKESLITPLWETRTCSGVRAFPRRKELGDEPFRNVFPEPLIFQKDHGCPEALESQRVPTPYTPRLRHLYHESMVIAKQKHTDFFFNVFDRRENEKSFERVLRGNKYKSFSRERERGEQVTRDKSYLRVSGGKYFERSRRVPCEILTRFVCQNVEIIHRGKKEEKIPNVDDAHRRSLDASELRCTGKY